MNRYQRRKYKRMIRQKSLQQKRHRGYHRRHILRQNKICRDGGGKNYKMGKASVKINKVDDCDGFGSRESQNEYCSTIQHRLLTQSWIQYDEKYGVSIDELI